MALINSGSYWRGYAFALRSYCKGVSVETMEWYISAFDYTDFDRGINGFLRRYT